MRPEVPDWSLTRRRRWRDNARSPRRSVTEDRFQRLRTVAGVDAGFPERGKRTRAAVVVMSFPALELGRGDRVGRSDAVPLRARSAVPSRGPRDPRSLVTAGDDPGCHSLRRAWDRAPAPLRQCLLTSAFATGITTVGVAKSRLTGTCDEPPAERGEWVQLLDKNEHIGAVVRTRAKVKPVFVSIGHRISLRSAIDLVLDCSGRYRLPEPIRARGQAGVTALISSVARVSRHGASGDTSRVGSGSAVRCARDASFLL